MPVERKPWDHTAPLLCRPFLFPNSAAPVGWLCNSDTLSQVRRTPKHHALDPAVPPLQSQVVSSPQVVGVVFTPASMHQLEEQNKPSTAQISTGASNTPTQMPSASQARGPGPSCSSLQWSKPHLLRGKPCVGEAAEGGKPSEGWEALVSSGQASAPKSVPRSPRYRSGNHDVTCIPLHSTAQAAGRLKPGRCATKQPLTRTLLPSHSPTLSSCAASASSTQRARPPFGRTSCAGSAPGRACTWGGWVGA